MKHSGILEELLHIETAKMFEAIHAIALDSK
jgi:hypothetical protein